MSAVFHDYIPLYFAGASATAGVTTSAAVKGTLAVPYKCQVRRVCVVATDTNSTGGTVSFIQRAVAGTTTDDSTTPYVDRGIFDVLTIPATSHQGKMYYEDPAVSVVLLPGQEVAWKADAALGVVWAFVLVERIPEVPANLSNMVAA